MTPTEELGLKGKGAELPKIKALDDALEEYQKAKKKRIAASLAEVPAKQKLVGLLNKHKEKLTVTKGETEGEGETISYRNGHYKVAMSTAKVSLKVGDDVEDEEEEAGQ